MSTSTQTTDETIQDFGGGKYGIGGAVNDYWQKVRGGDVGSLPAVLGALVLVIVFTVLRPDTFTKALNFANLIQQGAAVMVIAMGLVFVLLLGEIDLAAGFTAGTCGAVMGVMIKNHGWPWWAAILAALLTGVVIGALMGLLVSRLGIPSFVVTLAFFLSLQGVMLAIIGEGGTVTIQDKKILAIMNNNLPIWLGLDAVWASGSLPTGGSATPSTGGSKRPASATRPCPCGPSSWSRWPSSSVRPPTT